MELMIKRRVDTCVDGLGGGGRLGDEAGLRSRRRSRRSEGRALAVK